MTEEYPYTGRLSRWEEIAEGLAIVGVQALENPFPFNPGQYATLGLMGPEKLVQRPMSISSSADRLDEYEFFIRLVEGGEFTPLLWERRWATRSTSRAPRANSCSRTTGEPGCSWRAAPAWPRS